MRLILQPEGSSLCGQCCVAMAAGVTLKKAIKAVGHDKAAGTSTAEIVRALRPLGLSCQSKLRRVSRRRPALPQRAILVIHRPKEEPAGRREKWHWMLHWDGKIYDPGGCWPEGYTNWKITSYLEIDP